MMFLKYLKDRCWRIGALAVFVLIYYIVLSLYNLPAESVLYAAGLCVAAGAVMASVDFIRYRKRHLCLRELLYNVSISIDALPPTDTLIELDYQKLLRAAFDARVAQQTLSERERADMMEYFTLWAHQIKTPIAAMRLILQGEDGDLSHSLMGELFRIEQYAEMALNYMRLGSDSSDFVIRKYALDGIVKQVVRKYASLFIRKHLSLKLAPIESSVLTDEKWLCFALEQILSNALKYTNKGYISIFTENETTLVIQDTGVGIAEEDLPRVFDKGFTGLNGRADKRATGVGLYLTHRILTRLGHSIAIDSELGRGTIVRIDLHTDSLNVQD